jgi:hypothetical protein
MEDQAKRYRLWASGGTNPPDGLRGAFAPALEHFQAKLALGLDPRVDTGSPSENATT